MEKKVFCSAACLALAATGFSGGPNLSPAGSVRVSTVQPAPAYNSWPMIQTVGKKVVCAYSRGSAHTIAEGARGVYARTSADGGTVWGPEVEVVNDPSVGEVTVGKGRDEQGRMLLWVRRWGARRGHDLYRTADGSSFEKIASPDFAPMPMQVTDVFHVPGKGLVSLWFSGHYRNKKSGHAWGTLTSADNGQTWVQRTVEKDLPLAEWPTEPCAVSFADGRILALARSEEAAGCQFQLTSTDAGLTWTRAKTNIRDVRASTPSLLLDEKTGRLFNYYYQRGAKKLKRRTVSADFIFSRPEMWPPPETLAYGAEKRAYDAGNVNAVACGASHLLALYTGSTTDTAVFAVAAPLAEKPPKPDGLNGEQDSSRR